MKKIIYIFSLCFLALLYGCEDFLTVEAPDALTTQNFWRNEDDAESAISAAYSQLEYSIDTWAFAEVKWPVEAYREDIIELGSDARNYPNWVDLKNFTYTNGNSQFSNYWWNCYKGINFSNQVIDNIERIPEKKITKEKRNQIKNEAYFLRAYYHLKLLLNWKEIIVQDTYVNDPKKVNKALSTREVAWNFIVEDLNKAIKLPKGYDNDNIGRATSGAANAYLGFVYVTRAYEEVNKKDEYLQLALKAFEKVQGYNLEEDFLSMFTGDNKNSKESIFELQYTMSSANGANYRNQLHRWIGVKELWGWDEILPSKFLMTEFKKEGKTATTGRYDDRLYQSIFFRSEYFNDKNKRVYGYTYDDWFDKLDKPAFRKFMPRTYDGLAQNYTAINIPLMRYANVLLLQAEALNELNRSAEAIKIIDKVRKVHGKMPALTINSKEEVRMQIEHERIIEFPLENWRWYDLRRWNKLEEAMNNAGQSGFNLKKHAFYPTPLSEIIANDKVKK